MTFESTSIPFTTHVDPDHDVHVGPQRESRLCSLPLTSTCTATAPGPGSWTVGLGVVDGAGEDGSQTKVIAEQAPPAPPNEPPAAAVAALPASPSVGEEVTFVSYSQDRDGTIGQQAWDLDGNGAFDDASGPIATRRFAAPGQKTIALRVTDNSGAASTWSVIITVKARGRAAPPGRRHQRRSVAGPFRRRTLSPFPIVRLAGSVAEGGTGIDLLAVRAPRGSRVLVRCRGQGCPMNRIEKVVRRPPLRLNAAEQVMPAGVVLEVLVRRGDRIGKFTRFRFRHNRRPRRIDGCLWPGTAQMAPCPRRLTPLSTDADAGRSRPLHHGSRYCGYRYRYGDPSVPRNTAD